MISNSDNPKAITLILIDNLSKRPWVILKIGRIRSNNGNRNRKEENNKRTDRGRSMNNSNKD